MNLRAGMYVNVNEPTFTLQGKRRNPLQTRIYCTHKMYLFKFLKALRDCFI